MRRATYTQYRDPRERTPAALLPQVTCDGGMLFDSEEYRARNRSNNKMSKSRRFEEYYTIDKLTKERTGPGQYHPLTDLMDRIRHQSCFRFIKPEVVDEQLYEVVGGTTKVLRTDLFTEKQLRKFE